MYSKLSQLSVHLEPNMIRSVNPFQHTWKELGIILPYDWD